MSSLIHEAADAAIVPGVEAERVRAIPRPTGLGLAGRLLALTIGSVLLALLLFFTTRLSVARESWLRDRLMAAQTAALVFGGKAEGPLTPDLTAEILDTVGAKSISIEGAGRRLSLTEGSTPPLPDDVFDLTDVGFFEGVSGALRTLVAPRGSILRVEGRAPMDGARIEITIDQTPLIDALWRISTTFLGIALGLSVLVTCVLWAALWHLVIRPVRRLTTSIIAFGERPQDAFPILTPSARDDEIGRAEAALVAMQGSLARELSQRKRLAELGMAVARINHDLRNMLSAAQLISDRLAGISDPLAQRLAPRLVATLDRAIEFCQSTLSYGAAREQATTKRDFDLREVVREVVEMAEAADAVGILYAIDIPPHFELHADPDQVRRVIENLGRNAAQALQSQGACGERPPAIRFAAIRTGGVALIEVSDSGPGFSPQQAAHIFEPFHMSTREGGSGLGLAIAADLVARNGGSITLAPAQPEDFHCGARFLITLPTPESARKLSRAALAS
jgi:signal transduction histidine kinase